MSKEIQKSEIIKESLLLHLTFFGWLFDIIQHSAVQYSLFCYNRLHAFFFQLSYTFSRSAGIGDDVINLV